MTALFVDSSQKSKIKIAAAVITVKVTAVKWQNDSCQFLWYGLGMMTCEIAVEFVENNDFNTPKKSPSLLP